MAIKTLASKLAPGVLQRTRQHTGEATCEKMNLRRRPERRSVLSVLENIRSPSAYRHLSWAVTSVTELSSSTTNRPAAVCLRTVWPRATRPQVRYSGAGNQISAPSDKRQARGGARLERTRISLFELDSETKVSGVKRSGQRSGGIEMGLMLLTKLRCKQHDGQQVSRVVPSGPREPSLGLASMLRPADEGTWSAAG